MRSKKDGARNGNSNGRSWVGLSTQDKKTLLGPHPSNEIYFTWQPVPVWATSDLQVETCFPPRVSVQQPAEPLIEGLSNTVNYYFLSSGVCQAGAAASDRRAQHLSPPHELPVWI